MDNTHLDMNRYLVFDSDCFVGPKCDSALDWMESLDDDFDEIVIVGKNLRDTKSLKGLMDWWFPDANAIVVRPRKDKDSTEPQLAFILGKILGAYRCERATDVKVALFTTRSTVPDFVPELARCGIRVIVPASAMSRFLDADLPNVEIVELAVPEGQSPNPHPAVRPVPALPQWARDRPADDKPKIGFDVVEVPSTESHPSPLFIPFPETPRFTVGRTAPSGICLEAWDFGRKGLYSPHVEIEYVPMPDSFWRLRSMHGHRSGRNGVAVNGKPVQADSRAIPMQDGDEVVLGGFRLVFRTNRFEELLRYEEPYQLVKEIELGLKAIADADKIGIKDLISGDDMTGVPIKDWKQISWRQFDEIVSNLWEKPCFQNVKNAIESVDDLRDLLNKVKNARNNLAHPIKGSLKLIQRRHIVELYQLLRLPGGTVPTTSRN